MTTTNHSAPEPGACDAGLYGVIIRETVSRAVADHAAAHGLETDHAATLLQVIRGDVTQQEAADALGLCDRTIRNHVSRLRESLQRALVDIGETGVGPCDAPLPAAPEADDADIRRVGAALVYAAQCGPADAQGADALAALAQHLQERPAAPCDRRAATLTGGDWLHGPWANAVALQRARRRACLLAWWSRCPDWRDVAAAVRQLDSWAANTQRDREGDALLADASESAVTWAWLATLYRAADARRTMRPPVDVD